jgi:hypothetical protein
MSDFISQEQYEADFNGKKRKLALQHALDIRKFEIDLYWKRATYFWAFIAAAFVGYGAVETSTSGSSIRTDLAVCFSCLGIVFSFAWVCVNKGSKQWQENWENHVDMLEDKVTGPLYKIVMKRPKPQGWKEYVRHIATGPATFSASGVNQIISLFVTVVWVLLLWDALPPFLSTAPIRWMYVVLIVATVVACVSFLVLGRTYEDSYTHYARKRDTRIAVPDHRAAGQPGEVQQVQREGPRPTAPVT